MDVYIFNGFCQYICIVAQLFFVTGFYEIFQVQVYIRNMGKGFNNGGAFKAPVGAKTE